MSCFSDEIIMYEFGTEEIEAKDARIAELEKQVAELAEERERGRKIAGSYYVVPKETLDAKDARIKELESAAKTPACDHTSDAVLIGQYQHEIATLKAENAEFKARRNASKKHRDKENRLSCEDGKYDKCGVGGISVDAATKAAELAKQMLESGKSLSYAAACLLVLNGELEGLKIRYEKLFEYKRDSLYKPYRNW